uniref:Uncharacterized protein n=1 Tax=Peronospora matthiolae TaxID=2874970 RepID=A0AAV1UMM4_9STRA
MRPSIFVSAALLCLSACGNAVKADAGLENPVASSRALPASHDDAVATDDAKIKRYHVPAWVEDLHLDNDALPIAPDSDNDKMAVQHLRSRNRERSDTEYLDSSENNESSVSSQSSDSATGKESTNSVDSSDVILDSRKKPHHRLILYGLDYISDFDLEHQTVNQTLALLSQFKEKGGKLAELNYRYEEGYLSYILRRCAKPEEKMELACM